ncbi:MULTISPECIES: hypothetical protein [Streptomyces]|uniref:Uncharacterized protein n=1 Tax=Streptomyces scabiei (strain 87.22) TaxID=680198 RepID=C9Z2V6_STRSW|nr:MULTISPECIES: hypothetical protein [Streptomyces]KFG07875.1 hypothetical protein IQ61_17005 [Streptomyces scabiei]MBP5894700.1 hypothetical protein [Streptomyces sp. LBUM 1481]MBP5924968.1 hypothetical protein [Streptomyces sp. LBUM 1483]MDX2535439.1 hypothetical protein [Streptomyces scabiei]MDX2578591.1 hypothetical protein [Streptomyces scabiei]
MSVVVCSLKWEKAHAGRQRITYDSDGYHLVRFPYERTGESYDPWKMHDPANGGAAASAFPDPRSGLIWPSHDGWGVLSAMVFWDADPKAVEYRARFVRDPLNLTQERYDSTGTTDSVSTRGGQYRTFLWQMFVHQGMPLGLKVTARGPRDTRRATALILAEFKLAIHTDVAEP